MGGKVWSPEEERVYWRVIIPQSQKRAGPGNVQIKSWEELAPIMQSLMGANAKRTYTYLGLFEHYFQNVEKNRTSPNAAMYVRQHKEALAAAAQNMDEETENGDNEVEENATIFTHTHSTQDNARGHTAETAEEGGSDTESWDSIHEDKENHFARPARQPLAAIDQWSNFEDSNYKAPEPRMDTSNLSITTQAPRRGLLQQAPTSTERSTLTSQATRSPPHRYNFRTRPYGNPNERAHFSTSHRRTRTVVHKSVPAHLRGNAEDYEPGGRYFCLPTPDYSHQTRPFQHYEGGHAAGSTEQRQYQFMSSPQVGSNSHGNLQSHQYIPPVASGMSGMSHSSASISGDEKDFNSRGSFASTQYNSPFTSSVTGSSRPRNSHETNFNFNGTGSRDQYTPPVSYGIHGPSRPTINRDMNFDTHGHTSRGQHNPFTRPSLTGSHHPLPNNDLDFNAHAEQNRAHQSPPVTRVSSHILEDERNYDWHNIDEYNPGTPTPDERSWMKDRYAGVRHSAYLERFPEAERARNIGREMAVPPLERFNAGHDPRFQRDPSPVLETQRPELFSNKPQPGEFYTGPISEYTDHPAVDQKMRAAHEKDKTEGGEAEEVEWAARLEDEFSTFLQPPPPGHTSR